MPDWLRLGPLSNLGAHLRTRIIFKKIDSTLRGNVGPEVVATMAAFDCELALVTPAFPAAGRVVINGYLQVVEDTDFVPRELAACFHGIDVPVGLRDALCDDDLDAIVAEGLKRSERILWAGSAGLAAALARSLDAAAPPTLSFSPAAPIFCLGSNHAVTIEQQTRLIHHRAASLARRTSRPLFPRTPWLCAFDADTRRRPAFANSWKAPAGPWCSAVATPPRWSAALSTSAPSTCDGKSLPASPADCWSAAPSTASRWSPSPADSARRML